MFFFFFVSILSFEYFCAYVRVFCVLCLFTHILISFCVFLHFRYTAIFHCIKILTFSNEQNTYHLRMYHILVICKSEGRECRAHPKGINSVDIETYTKKNQNVYTLMNMYHQ